MKLLGNFPIRKMESLNPKREIVEPKIQQNNTFQAVTTTQSIPSSANLQAMFVKKAGALSFEGVNEVFKSKLGANFDGKNMHFGILSKNATRVELCLFKDPLGEEVKRIPLNKKSNISWNLDLPGKEIQKDLGVDLKKGDPLYYGYRVWGPNWEYDKDWQPGSDKGFKSHVDGEGNRFDPNKLLIDPYAKEISHDPVSPEVQGIKDRIEMSSMYRKYTSGPDNGTIDTAKIAPKSIFVSSAKTADIGEKPTRALKDDIIYEVHLKGLTKNDPKIPEELRGTYKGAALKARELKELGITAIELLPVQETQNDQNDMNTDHQGSNYWGYMTLNFFSPDRRYAADKSPGGPTKEFKEMVKAFHDEGIKVFMDVVYNHTAEGAVWDNDPNISNIYSMRGFDNQTYYETHNGYGFWDDSGCGSNFNAANPITHRLISDSLDYWANDLGVDGFRFDLATILGNDKEKGGFYFNIAKQNSVLNTILKRLPVRPDEGGKGVDLIAEPWGASANGTYQVGNFPNGWSEWNDKYRDILRRAENRCDDVSPGEIANALSGTSYLYQHQGRKTRASVNFVTAHDGFTMKDLVSYNNKVNIGSDGGSDNNTSWDHFGDFKLQRQAVRNLLTLLMTSAGVPMINGGDEMLRTTGGNNNPWNIDGSVKDKFGNTIMNNYLNWNLDENEKRMQNFTKKLIEFRQSHPCLKPTDYYEGKDHNGNGIKDASWFKPDGNEADPGYMISRKNHFIGLRTDCTEFVDPKNPENKDNSLYIAYNKGASQIPVTLPPATEGKSWYLLADTDDFMEEIGNFLEKPRKIDTPYDLMDSRTVKIFVER